jgi:hypothetical protein
MSVQSFKTIRVLILEFRPKKKYHLDVTLTNNH